VIYSLSPLQNAVTMYRLHLQQRYTVSRHELLLTDFVEKYCELLDCKSCHPDHLGFPVLEATLNHAVVSRLVTRTEPKPFVRDVTQAIRCVTQD